MNAPTTPTAYPIRFIAPMIRALLAGQETQTRRLIKPQPSSSQWARPPADLGYRHEIRNLHGRVWQASHHIDQNPQADRDPPINCPYGQPGDLLWVRETWQAVHFVKDFETGIGEGFHHARDIPPAATDYWQIVYAADPGHADNPEERGFPWRSSIYMPRWASRITLRVTDVRVERVQDISADDATAEGVRIPVNSATGRPVLDISSPHAPAQYLANPREFDPADWLRAHYAALWDSINAGTRVAWAENPWVWVVCFERVRTDEGIPA